MVRSGWKIIEVGNDGVWHYGSGVIRENSERWFVVKRFADIEREIYIEKWKDDEDMRSRVEI